MQRIDYVILGAAAVGLLLVGMLFLPSGPSQFNINTAYDEGCSALRAQNCSQDSITTITALTSGKHVYSLGNICATKGFTNTLSCANSCGCNATGGSASLDSTPLVAYSDTPIQQGIVEDNQSEIPEDNTTGDYNGI